MGLDNIFVLKNKKDRNIEAVISSFRNYYEFNENFYGFEPFTWDMVSDVDRKYYDGDSHPDVMEYQWVVKKEALSKLQATLEPIYNKLMTFPAGYVSYYDDNEYPEDFYKEFYNNPYNPADSNSAFAGSKLIHLYNSVSSILEFLEENRVYNSETHTYDDGDWYISFISSF